MNRNSLKNLEKGKKFSPADPRINRDGISHRARYRKKVFAQWLDVETNGEDPDGNTVHLHLLDKIALSLINRAVAGDVAAANLVLNNAYGKIKEEPEEEQKPKKTLDLSKYTPEQLQQLSALVEIGAPDEFINEDED